uniref:Uncharacterized protein n=1 Tax=Ananas comosus var. bracteatus TaxID=296719 RepID=A0A6V7PYX9_ANACO|nr:unnamed protein product [Ananas comosus var. bracteatus]
MVALRKAKPMEILKKSMPSAEHSVPLMPVTGTDALRPVPDRVLNRLIPKRVARPHKTKDKASEAKGPSLTNNPPLKNDLLLRGSLVHKQPVQPHTPWKHTVTHAMGRID